MEEKVNTRILTPTQCECLVCHNDMVVIEQRGSFGNVSLYIPATYCWACGTKLVYPSIFSPNNPDKLLQKDIPTRPEYRTLSGDILCSNCHNYLGAMYTKFEQVERCPECNHLIDWSVD